MRSFSSWDFLADIFEKTKDLFLFCLCSPPGSSLNHTVMESLENLHVIVLCYFDVTLWVLAVVVARAEMNDGKVLAVVWDGNISASFLQLLNDSIVLTFRYRHNLQNAERIIQRGYKCNIIAAWIFSCRGLEMIEYWCSWSWGVVELFIMFFYEVDVLV